MKRTRSNKQKVEEFKPGHVLPMADSSIRVLAMDPSLTAWGWVVLDGHGIVIAEGAIKTKPVDKKLRIRKGDDRVRRITEINHELLRIIKKYHVGLIVSEQPHGSQSAVVAIMIGIVLGIVQTISDVRGLALEWYSEQDCKKMIAGKSSVGKDEMIEIVKKLYMVSWTGFKWKDEAIADSIAVYHIARQHSEILKFFNK